MAKNYKKLRQIYQDDPEMLSALAFEEQQASIDSNTELMKEYYKEKGLSETGKSKFDFLQDFFREFLSGKDGDTPTDEKLIELITPLIPDPVPGSPGIDGKDFVPTEQDLQKIANKVRVPVAEKVIEKTEVIKEQPIVTEKLIEKDIDEEKLFNEFVKFLKKKKPLSTQDINGMQGFSKDGINYRFEELMHGGGSSSGTVSLTYSVDLSGQVDSVNKVFTVPANDAFILLTGTDAPFVYRPVVDYTGTGTTTLTLDAGVNAPSLGSTLILTYKST